MSEMMTQAKYAVHRGVDRSAVTKWKRAGLLVLVKRGEAMLVDVKATDALIAERVDPGKGRPNSGGSRPAAPSALASTGLVRPLHDVRSDLGEEDIIAKRIANAESVKQLVPMDEVVRRVSELARMARERAHAELRAVNDRLALEADPHNAAGIWGKALDKAFTTLASAIESGALVAEDSEDEEEPEPEDE